MSLTTFNALLDKVGPEHLVLHRIVKNQRDGVFEMAACAYGSAAIEDLNDKLKQTGRRLKGLR